MQHVQHARVIEAVASRDGDGCGYWLGPKAKTAPGLTPVAREMVSWDEAFGNLWSRWASTDVQKRDLAEREVHGPGERLWHYCFARAEF